MTWKFQGSGAPVRHPHEIDRLESLRSYGVLGTGPEPEFDAITMLASKITASPVAAIALVDAEDQWFKSLVGLDEPATDRDGSFCAEVVGTGRPLTVTDARRDPRFCDLAMVSGPAGVRSYAGVPLIGRDGLPVGALSVMDRRPRRFSGQQLQLLARLADQAMFILELRRGDRARGFSPSAPADELRSPTRIRAALDQGELVPYFQPQVDLATGRVSGLEALLRWEHPTLGTVQPAQFLPVVESSGLILPVGRQILRASLELLTALRHVPEADGLLIGVNVSVAQLRNAGLGETVMQEVERCGCSPEQVVLEITETADLVEDRVVLNELVGLREAGVGLALDDYGTGFSSLERVLELPITTLKLDRSIVRRVPRDRRASIVADSTVQMARGLGLAVAAEGIESPAQHDAMRDLGYDLGQGFLFSRPVPGSEVGPLLSRQARTRLRVAHSSGSRSRSVGSARERRSLKC